MAFFVGLPLFGPSEIKYSLGFPSIKYPAKPAKKIEMIAEPGRAKASGYPDARANAIKKINKKRKNNSIIYSFLLLLNFLMNKL